MILLTKQYTDENCKFIKFARIFTYERQFGKRKSMLFLTILSKKKFHSVRGKNIILLTILLNILFCGKKKHLLLSILCKEKLFWGKILFSWIRNSFLFFKSYAFYRSTRVPNSTKVPKEEFKVPFSYLLCVNQRGFLISSSLVKYYIFYDFRQSLCRFN